MKVGDMKELAKNAPYDVLLAAFCEAYKKVQRGKKEELDDILVPLFQSGTAKKPKPKKAPLETVDQLEEAVSDFAEKAYKDYFYYDNDIVPKAERPKWRFAVKDFLKAMDMIPEDAPDYARVAALYITLYQVLSHGHVEHMFRGDDPFRSIDYPQEKLLERMISANLAADDSPEKLYELIHTICRGYPNPEMSQAGLQRHLLPLLDTEERRENALEQAMKLSEEYIGRLGKERSFSTWITSESIEDNCCAEGLSEMVLQIARSISPERYLSCLDFYYEHCYERDHEIALYRALDILYGEIYWAEEGTDTSEPKRIWVACYEDALRRGIQPREELQEQYATYKG